MDLINLGIREILIIIVAFFYLIIGSIEDIKTREIMDYSNFSLVIIGFILNLMFSLIYNNWFILLQSILGFIAFFIIAYIMFYAGQWGGGDSKMIMGLGALFGLNFETIPFILVFFIASLFLGSIYGLIWTLSLAFKYWKKFIIEYKNRCNELSNIRNYILFFLSGLILITLFFSKYFLIYSLSVAFVIIIGYYMWIFVKSIENSVMYKNLRPDELTEGDWIVDDLYFNKKIFMKKKTLSKEDVNNILYYIDKNNFNNIFLKIKVNSFFKKKLIDLKIGDIINENISTTYFNFKKGHIITEKDLKLFDNMRKIKIKRKFIFWNFNKNVFLSELKLNDIILNKYEINFIKFKNKHLIIQDDLNKIKENLNKNKLINVKVQDYFSKKEIKPENLKEYMDLAEDLYQVDYICGPKDLGISREQIVLLKEHKIKTILVKEGIPFVPSFLMAFIFCLFFYNQIIFLF
jgi:Flp pilus assembly protein protease CpaA